MPTPKAECSECGAKRLCIVLQVCVPVGDEDEGIPHEKIHDILICRQCVAKMGSMGMWIADMVRSYFARHR
jgi:hypothetical protein